MNEIKIVVKEDKSVERKLIKTAQQLKNKYKGKKRVINEDKLKPKKPLRKAINVVVDFAIVIIVLTCGLLCFTNINSRFQGMPPSFGGFSAMQVVSGSMVKSGFKIGDVVMIKSVDTDTLKEEDIIAFYVYAQSFRNFKKSNCTKIDTSNIGNIKTKISLKKFFGFQEPIIKEAAVTGSKLVFHHIKAVYEDKVGVRWFKTYGSSNSYEDSWYVREDLVVGAYDSSGIAKTMAVGLGSFSSSWTMVACILIPLVLVAFTVIGDCMINVQLAWLECEVIDGKRKLTDKVCRENNIGYKMDKKTKYKVLASAPPHKKLEYVSLLWKNGSAPSEIKKYYLRKGMILRPLEEINKLHIECEKMFNDGVSEIKVAKYYNQRMKEIENKQEHYKKVFKQLRKKMKDKNNSLLVEDGVENTISKSNNQNKNTKPNSNRSRNRVGQQSNKAKVSSKKERTTSKSTSNLSRARNKQEVKTKNK